MGVPTGAVPETTTLLPVEEDRSAPTAGPPVMLMGVAAATCEDDGARSKTVIQRRVTVPASVARISVRHILFQVEVSEEKWSVLAVAAFAGRRMVIDPANCPLLTSNRCKPGAGALTSTGFAGKWNARY